ncbi:L,D-transpeptidase family protein [Acinetobacter pragensis]|uniref:L,D-transpeptidase catalytic domain protein n=1 Tax=Acinetobacter pragensis TaxID=1806892 RepID=A0A151XZP3_9GAMM|nr:L,D-transpeptidase family protein [Acinetobacter pragensis]KYQ71164.1 L,D-transpeptidase catalytic domain protein [Acinetobacter pragensis]
MKKKHLFILGGILLICLFTAYAAYQKYNKYLPTSAGEVLFPVPLSAAQIQSLRKNSPIDSIHVYKSQRYLVLQHQNTVVRRYPIRLGFAPTGHKVQEGDGKTPEGRYELDWRNAQSSFYKSLHISYPNALDLDKAKKLSVSSGGNIMIHGSATAKQVKAFPQLMTYFPQKDWTWGCIAVRNIDIDEIWQLVNNGTVIEIHP